MKRFNRQALKWPRGIVVRIDETHDQTVALASVVVDLIAEVDDTADAFPRLLSACQGVDGGGLRFDISTPEPRDVSVWVRYACDDDDVLQVTDLPRDMPLIGGYGRHDGNRLDELSGRRFRHVSGFLDRRVVAARHAADHGDVAFYHQYMCRGDYANMGAAGIANLRAWAEEYDGRDWWHEHHGGYGSTSIGVDVAPNGCEQHPDGWYADACDCDSCEAYRRALETLDALDDYPIIDESLWSEVEHELVEEAIAEDHYGWDIAREARDADDDDVVPDDWTPTPEQVGNALSILQTEASGWDWDPGFPEVTSADVAVAMGRHWIDVESPIEGEAAVLPCEELGAFFALCFKKGWKGS